MKKITILITLFSFFLPPVLKAELRSGYFEGKVSISFSAAVNPEDKTYEQDVQIFVRVTEEDPTLAFGVILRGDRGSVYRIEELEDGTQSWMTLFEGSDHSLRVKDDFSPLFKGHGTPKEGSSSKRLTLKLLPHAGQTATDGVKSIEVTQVYQKEWVAILEPKVPLTLNFDQGEEGSKGILKGDTFRGTLIFYTVSLEGNFSLTPVTPYLATVRSQVLNSENISGWSQSREITGLALLIFDHGRKGNFLGIGGQKPKYELMFMRFLGDNFVKTSLFKKGDGK